ncbi:F420-dependent oxidoreductase-like protein [Crossiella equi]|uniref:F420-dependent oxidoreductase-like protein n=1 Tax=Crossiella equi TaxID=130796 RepID=A0ABS5ANA4_9PSEU|nr:LLM class F420-dependent oxidoreductase [Crossiella equi]MBP2478063.1 F420-dependent oxidoreductase-like protein [Crossiella equi]
MKVATTLGYWSAGPPADAATTIKLADDLGFDSVWTAEAYGSDVLTPLAWWGAGTTRVKLGTAIAQMAARPPTTLAMAAMTLDHLSNGRAVIGIGASNPQVVEGWYGVPYPRPLERTREYIDVMRKVIAREGPVTYEGKHFQLPLRGHSGMGKPLKSTLHPFRTEIPIHLAAEGPKNVALAAEIADGWLPLWLSPKTSGFFQGCLEEGFARPGARHTKETFEVVGGPFSIVVDDDVDAAADWVRPVLALYAGGMGAKDLNFHHNVIARAGWEAECRKIQELYLAGDKQGAIAAVPTAMVEDFAIVGPLSKVKEEIEVWKQTVVTTFSINTLQTQYLPQLAEFVLA